MRRLDLNNVSELQDHINQIDPSHFYSALTYYSWSFYGLDISYHLVEDGISFFGEPNLEKNLLHELLHDKFTPTQKVIVAPITKPNQPDLFLALIKKQIDQLDKNQPIFIDDLTSIELEWLKTKYSLEVIHENSSNFLYETKKLISLAGKNLQKKRNHLNFFLKEYEKDATIKINNDVDFNQLEKFYLEWINDWEDPTSYQAELALFYAIRPLIDDGTLKLTALYYLEKIIGFCVSYSVNNRCEIFIEHCDEKYRGSYQYLLSNSLKIHHINDPLTDRQDDMGSASIFYSKLSYKPEFIIKRYLVKIIC
ncbi:phosphatidylglycerol lysyltransferase domain-containing protein [[Mycoplasma] imitans]|uniref:phosphatidylglycerol lysyltransferase domain-containing protein n=1 Tax=[Mycoplasma] imitans TaxID=29560 RepID=UPI0004875BD2|nr:phosphatidylglycerol lysyltransferase domain-containing protein [[Mycoplasma] imitans]